MQSVVPISYEKSGKKHHTGSMYEKSPNLLRSGLFVVWVKGFEPSAF